MGWSQVSLKSIDVARRKGALTLLEHPMPHVDTWIEIGVEEYQRWCHGPASRRGLWPDSLIRRMRREYDAADIISVPCTYVASTFINAGIHADRLVRIPLGVDTTRFRPAQRHDGPFRILFVGRVELWKGAQYLLQAFSQLKTTNAELWLAGRVLPEIEGTLARFGGDRVRVLGQVPNADMPGIYQQADVLVFPTLLDGFSLAIAEAMACGIPVIATEHSSGPDVIDDGTDGFVIPVRDVDAIVDKVTWLDQHRGHAREMGVAVRKRSPVTLASIATLSASSARINISLPLILPASDRRARIEGNQSPSPNWETQNVQSCIHLWPTRPPSVSPAVRTGNRRRFRSGRFSFPLARSSDPSFVPLPELGNLRLCFPRRHEYDLFLTDGPHIPPLVLKQLGLLRKNQRVAALMANEMLYFLKAGHYSRRSTRGILFALSRFDALICLGAYQTQLAHELLSGSKAQAANLDREGRFLRHRRREFTHREAIARWEEVALCRRLPRPVGELVQGRRPANRYVSAGRAASSGPDARHRGSMGSGLTGSASRSSRRKRESREVSGLDTRPENGALGIHTVCPPWSGRRIPSQRARIDAGWSSSAGV